MTRFYQIFQTLLTRAYFLVACYITPCYAISRPFILSDLLRNMLYNMSYNMFLPDHDFQNIIHEGFIDTGLTWCYVTA